MPGTPSLAEHRPFRKMGRMRIHQSVGCTKYTELIGTTDEWCTSYTLRYWKRSQSPCLSAKPR